MTAQEDREIRAIGRIREKNYETILKAAEIEFVANGFRGTSMQAIADRADLPKANIHYYFENKANLYSAVLDEIIHLWNDFLDDLSEEDEPAEVLRRFIEKKIRLSYTRPNASKLFAQEIIQGAPNLKEYLRTELRQWLRDKCKVIEAWVSAGKMDPIEPAYLIFLIWSSTQHYADFDTQVLTLLNRAEYEEQTIEEISEFLTRVILKGIGVKTPRSTKSAKKAAKPRTRRR